MYWIIGLFAIAAAFGLFIFIKWMNGKDAPRIVVYAHGLIAATALVGLIVYAAQHADNIPKASIALFVIGALGGFVLFYNDIFRAKKLFPVAVLHALLGVSGFILLLFFAFK